MRDQVKNLKNLGTVSSVRYINPTREILETFPNQYPHRKYITKFIFDEFTSLCPKTHQPDFAKITIEYIPDETCIETKSLKLYYGAYRQYGSFMETLTNKILEDCMSVCSPHWMKITSEFNPRGGTHIQVIAEYTK